MQALKHNTTQKTTPNFVTFWWQSRLPVTP